MKRVSLVVIALFLVGCRFATDARPTSVPATFPVSGGIAPGTYELQLGSQGESRKVIVHIPPQYDGGTQLPLLIVLHGGGGSGEQIQRMSEMDSDADEYGFVAVYPDGSSRFDETLFTWNSGHCCGYALTHQVDDLGFISLLVDNMVAHYTIDPNRVYLTGISNGGMMSYRAGAELSEKVAGIAPVAGTIGGALREGGIEIQPPQPSEPVSVIAFNGKQDQHVLYEGGAGPEAIDAGRVDISVERSIAFWVQANGCDAEPSSATQAGGNIIVDTYSGCAAGSSVVLVTIVDGGHAWPGGPSNPLGDPPTQDISANQMMLEFFLAHPKNNN